MSQPPEYEHEETFCEQCNEPSNNVSSYANLYKYSDKLSLTQEKKRELFLQKLKEKRCEAFDIKRNLSELFPEDSNELMDCECSVVRNVTKKFPFGFKLMGSEWLTEAPDDLSENWFIKLCPGGIRYLVIANRAITTCYFKNGKVSIKFKSNLPGGNADDLSHKFTVLDCIFNKESGTFFIYDVLAWNSTSFINAEAHMRFYWIKSKFEENADLYKIRHQKKYEFVVVDFFAAKTDLLQDRLFNAFTVNENVLPIEGVLFYHKEGHYISGSCPLVGWLKTFMIPEILHIDVPSNQMQNKPENYESIQQYLNYYKTKKNRKLRRPPKMETEEIDDGENIECDKM